MAFGKKIALKYDVQNIKVESLRARLSSKEASEVLVFDTREKEEYETSHIQSAHLVDPGMSADVFIQTYGNRIQGKHLIFYCSVGERSSLFIERIRERALKKGPASLSNLQGGIFRWYNENYPVFNRQGETDAIHPFDHYWGRFVRPRNKTKP
ncbi:MAG: rhodanese-like domain-containing protein [Pseudomonadota bacterium]